MIVLQGMGGIAPMVMPARLPDNLAQTANSLVLYNQQNAGSVVLFKQTHLVGVGQGSQAISGNQASTRQIYLVSGANSSLINIGNAVNIFSGATTYINTWDGATWVQGTLKKWDGSKWAFATLKRWNGSNWI